MSKEISHWPKWRTDLEPQQQAIKDAVKKSKKFGKIKLVAAFGVGASLGTAATGFIAWKIFKSFFGGWLKYGMKF